MGTPCIVNQCLLCLAIRLSPLLFSFFFLPSPISLPFPSHDIGSRPIEFSSALSSTEFRAGIASVPGLDTRAYVEENRLSSFGIFVAIISLLPPFLFFFSSSTINY